MREGRFFAFGGSLICLSMTIFLSSLFHVFGTIVNIPEGILEIFAIQCGQDGFPQEMRSGNYVHLAKKRLLRRRRRTAQVHETRLLLNCKLQQPLSCFAILSSSHHGKTLFPKKKVQDMSGLS